MTNTFFHDLTYQSRGIEKLADQVDELVHDFYDYAGIIDVDYDPNLEDEELEEHNAKKVWQLKIMVISSILGRDISTISELKDLL